METMSNAETYFQKYIKDMTDFVEGKVRREVKPTGDIYDTRRTLIAPMVVLFGFGFGIYAVLKK